MPNHDTTFTVQQPVSPPTTAATRFPLMSPAMAFGQAAFVLAALYVFLRGWRRDFTVPFGFWIDSLFYLMQAKSTIDNGWWWFNPMVGAPLGLDELAFPANGNVDQVLVWIVSRVVPDPLMAVNLTWMLMVATSGVAASWCMRTLGFSRTAALVAGTLFALTPYALYKNIGHFGMAIYLVPFICTVALQLASGRLPERGYLKGPGLALLVGSALIGFNYVYYPFFGCFFLVVGAAAGFLTFRERRILHAGAVALVVVGGCTLLNLAPSLASWNRQGKPIIFIDKIPAQAEVYALKIRSLVSPTYQHWFPPFRKWVEKEQMSQYPLEAENMTSRLGAVATIGFLALLALLLAPTIVARSRPGQLCLGASQLTVGGLLLATTGGFGALFSLLVTPDIRAFARICPFLAFFALIAVAVALDSARWSRSVKLLLAAFVLAIGLADQSTAASGMNNDYPVTVAELPQLKSFVRQLEERLPAQSMVLQLPFRRTFLNEVGAVAMKPYEHLKPYLVSRHLRWSYPALTNDSAGWQESAARLRPEQLPLQMAAEGFAAIVIDRLGYKDNGEAMAATIAAVLGSDDAIVRTDRFIAFDIRPLQARADLPPRLPIQPEAMSRGLTACAGQTPMFIERAGRSRLPFANNQALARASGPIKISGWGVDQPGGSVGAAVDIVVDGAAYPTFYGLDRLDVSNHFADVGYRHSGFAGELPANTLTAGEHTLAVRVIATTGACYYEGAAMKLVVR